MSRYNKSISPLPPPPTVPKRVDKMRHFARRRLPKLVTVTTAPPSAKNTAVTTSKADHHSVAPQDTKTSQKWDMNDTTLVSATTTTTTTGPAPPSNDDIIADLTATERAKVWVQWTKTTPVFPWPHNNHNNTHCHDHQHHDYLDDGGSTSTATSSSSSVVSEETFTSSAAQLGSTSMILSKDAVSSSDTTTESTSSDDDDDNDDDDDDDVSSQPSFSSTRVMTVSSSTLFSEEDSAVVTTPEPTIVPRLAVVTTRRVVTFDNAPPQTQYLSERLDTIAPADKELRWYSRKEIAYQRKEMKHTILIVRKDDLGVDLLVDDSHLQPRQCVTGCERYYSMEGRFMAQRMVVDAVLENKGILPAEELGDLCRMLSQSSKELAAWHAQLVAVQCWGLAALTANGGSSMQIMTAMTMHNKASGSGAVGCNSQEQDGAGVYHGMSTPIVLSPEHFRTPSPPSPAIEVEVIEIPKVVSKAAKARLDVPVLSDDEGDNDNDKNSRLSFLPNKNEPPLRLIPRPVPYAPSTHPQSITMSQSWSLLPTYAEAEDQNVTLPIVMDQSPAPATHSPAPPAVTTESSSSPRTSFKETLDKWKALAKTSAAPVGSVPSGKR